MGTSHETQLRLGILLFPDHRIALIDPLKFRIIYHVDFCILRNQIFSVFYSLRSDIFHMVQTYRTVGSSRCAEVFQIGLCCIIQFTAQPLVQSYDIGNIRHHFHTDGRSKQLCFRLFRGLDLHDPGGFSAFIRQQAKTGHIAYYRAHEVNDTGVTIASCSQYGVGINHCRRLRPGQHLSHGRGISHFIHVTGAGVSILFHDTQLCQLFLVIILLGVHEILEHKIL